MITVYRIGKFAFQNFWRNIWLSIITVTILVLTLLTVNILLVLNVIGQTAVKTIEAKIDVSVTFTPETSTTLIGNARGYLLSLPQVKDVRTLSPEEVLRDFRADNAGNPDVLASLDEVEGNPFGGQLVILANNPEDFDFILEALESPEYKPSIADKDFEDHQVVIQNITTTFDKIRTGGIILGGIFLLITVLIIVNTIRVAIYTHREEIGIMRLVGAPNFFIRAPFLVEAMLYTLIAVLVTIAIVYPTISLIEPALDAFFQTTPTGLLSYFTANFELIFGLQLAALCIINMVATGFAMRKYLQV